MGPGLPYRSIVAGTDGSPSSLEAVRQASAIARAAGARLHLVHALRPAAVGALVGAGLAVNVDLGDMSRQLEHEAELVLRRAIDFVPDHDIDVECHARPGAAAEVIVEVAEQVQADLIVIGNKGMTGARRFLLGSVPNRVAHSAPCSVLVVNTV